jgi:hypothetical protein
MVLVAVPIKVHLEKFPKKNLFDKKRWLRDLILICQKHASAGVGTFPRRGVAVVSKGQSLNHSG